MPSAVVLVDKATSDLLTTPDWTMNMDICDSINNDHWQAKHVMKAIKKRLQSRRPNTQLLALTLLETMIKNCGEYVHQQVAERNILHEMIKIVRKKTDMNVREKILILIDSWKEAFGGPEGKYPQYYWTYEELKICGVEFPPRPPNVAPLFALPFTYPVVKNSQPECESSGSIEEVATKMENLNSIHAVMEILEDMLQAMNPNDQEAIKDDIIADLVSQCRSNQKRLMYLVDSSGNEEILAKCLELNEKIQTLLTKYDTLAAVFPLQIEAVGHKTKPKNITMTTASDQADQEEEEEDYNEEENDTPQLVHRRSKAVNPFTEANTLIGTEDHKFSLNKSSITTTFSSGSTHLDPLKVVQKSNQKQTTGELTLVPEPEKELDMIELLTANLSDNTALSCLMLPASNQLNQHSAPSARDISNGDQPNHSSQDRFSEERAPLFAPISHEYHPHSHQSHSICQEQVSYNSYIAPWAQPQLAYQMKHNMPQYSSYSQSQRASSGSTLNPFLFPEDGISSPQWVVHPSNSLRKQEGGVASMNAKAGHKSFVLPDKLFEDLVTLKNADIKN